MNSQAHTPSRSSFPVVVALIGLLLLFWFLASKVYIRQPELAQTQPDDRPSLAEHRGQAQTTLHNYEVRDAASGQVRVPIERAKELIIAERSQDAQ